MCKGTVYKIFFILILLKVYKYVNKIIIIIIIIRGNFKSITSIVITLSPCNNKWLIQGGEDHFMSQVCSNFDKHSTESPTAVQ